MKKREHREVRLEPIQLGNRGYSFYFPLETISPPFPQPPHLGSLGEGIEQRGVKHKHKEVTLGGAGP